MIVTQMKIQKLINLWYEIKTLPAIEIQLGGDDISRSIFKSFTKPHPKYKIIQNKRWGVALLPLPDTFELYLSGQSKKVVRTNRKTALAKGLYFEQFDSLPKISEILAINQSAPIRQGQQMQQGYLDVDQLEIFCTNAPRMFGVFDAQHTLKAYAYTPICGEIFLFSRLLGHAGNLEEGIMYLLVSETIREMIRSKQATSTPKWAMYDTFLGAATGLQYFKRRMGFQPYKVKWI